MGSVLGSFGASDLRPAARRKAVAEGAHGSVADVGEEACLKDVLGEGGVFRGVDGLIDGVGEEGWAFARLGVVAIGRDLAWRWGSGAG
jgi:hypothetical protein